MEEIKRRRGRPRSEHVEIAIKAEAEYFPEQARGYCPRSLQNHAYILSFVSAMKNKRRWSWLWEERGDKWKRKTMLASLGRICAACGNNNLRFNHVLEHREDKRQIWVGICCATTLMEESDIPYLCETEVKRKEHWRIHYNKPGRCRATPDDVEARARR
jgi:hypothetical protein